MDSNSSTLRYF